MRSMNYIVAKARKRKLPAGRLGGLAGLLNITATEKRNVLPTTRSQPPGFFPPPPSTNLKRDARRDKFSGGRGCG